MAESSKKTRRGRVQVGDVWVNYYPPCEWREALYVVTTKQADGSDWAQYFSSEAEANAAAQAARMHPRGAAPEDLRIAYWPDLAAFTSSLWILAELLPSGSEWFRYFETAEEAQATAAARIRALTEG